MTLHAEEQPSRACRSVETIGPAGKLRSKVADHGQSGP